MIVKARGCDNGDVEIGLKCGECGFWEIIPVAIPKAVRIFYKSKIQDYEEEQEIPGFYVCTACRPEASFGPKSERREDMGGGAGSSDGGHTGESDPRDEAESDPGGIPTVER